MTEKAPPMHLDSGQILARKTLYVFQPCIYYLIDATNEVVYAGKTVNLQDQLVEHRRAGMEFVRFRFHTCELDELDGLEQKAIDRFRPTHSDLPKTKPISGHLSKQLICLKHNITPIAFERLREVFKLNPASSFGNAKYYKPDDVEAWVRRFKGLVRSGRHVLQAMPTYLAIGISTRTKLIQVNTKQ